MLRAIGITNSEADIIINKYFETYPKIKEYMEATVMQAELHGMLKLYSGGKDTSKQNLQARTV